MSSENLIATPLTAALGAEVTGIDLTQNISTELYQALRKALVEHQVLFFRDQNIEPKHQRALAQLFGPLQTHPAYGTVPGLPEVTILESTAQTPSKIEQWHTDMTFRAHPPMGTILRSRVVPEQGGDTLWASMSAAYDALSPALQKFLQPLTAAHDFRHGFRESLAEPGGEVRLAQAITENPPVIHPVIRKHPESGKRLIFVNELFTTHIRELALAESDHILALLFEHIRSPEFCCRFQWSENAVAFWDNRSTQHKPINDYFPAHRLMERVTIDGDMPY
ncbi:taurine dioxygenase [Halieaceae bacterium IMCC14734]|uniref:Taurine dioxygenase n=1 Tax=Candidatus Litorirhabdus singularis TaxID=2518993 RepID=A0ABT3TC64_9GAMM|nr:taurine dioxygenase [Candidatus Litorirhabdus singularis]MCX2979870.1 taurine dioxygenase [Candidatus Litorirhabdus singularis]